MSKYQIAVVRGDGIGPEVCDSAVQVVTQAAGASRFDLVDLPAGAVHYQKTGTALPEETFQGRPSKGVGSAPFTCKVSRLSRITHGQATRRTKGMFIA